MSRSVDPAIAGLGIGLVICADVGAIHALPPAQATGPAIALGIAGGLAFPGSSPASRARPGLAAIAAAGTAPLWLPALDRVSATASAAIAAAAGPVLLAVVAGLATRWAARRGARVVFPGAAGPALAGLLAPLLLMSVVTRTGAVAAGLVGGLLWAVGTRRTEPSTTGPRDGFTLGLVLGGLLPTLLFAVGPLVGPSVGLLVRSVAAIVCGAAVAALLRRRAPRVAAGLQLGGPAIAAAAALAALSGPRLVVAAATEFPGSLEHAPLLLGGTVVLALGVAAACTASGGRLTGPGAVLGLAVWWFAPERLGPGPAVLVVTALWAVALVPRVQALGAPRSRAAAAAIVALGASSLLWPTPPDGLRAFAPHALQGRAGELGSVFDRFGRAASETFGDPRGQLVLFDEEGVPRAWLDGRSRRLDPRIRDPNRYFGYLPALVGPVPERALILGTGLGAAADALRRVGPVEIVAYDANPAVRRSVERLREWNRDVAVDPAVRRVQTDPLFGRSDLFDAVLVDLPPLWAFGSGAAYSTRRVRRVADVLAPGGVAVFRLPLTTLSADELRRVVGRVAAEFGSVTAWLDPAGAEHLLLTATREVGRVDAAAVYRAWERPAIRDDLRAAAVDRPSSVLDRALADGPALALMGTGLPPRDAVGVAILAGRRLEAGSRALPLAALGAAAVDPATLFDVDRVPPEERADLQERLARAGQVRGRYLEMLGHLASGNPTAAMEAAKELPAGGATSDLRVITEPWLRRGDALMASDRIEAAHAEYLLAFSFSPRDLEANRKLADTYRLQGRLEDAQRHYGTALELDPTNLEASLGLADAYARGGDLRQAAGVLAAIEQVHAGSYVLLVHLAHFHSELAAENPREAPERAGRARALLQRAAALEPTRPEARAGLARVYYLQEEYDRALTEIDRALTLESSCLYRFWRGLIQYQLGTLDGAAAELKNSLLTCPDNHDARNALGAVYAAEGKPDQAEATWRDVLARDPENVAAKQNLETLAATTFVQPE